MVLFFGVMMMAVIAKEIIEAEALEDIWYKNATTRQKNWRVSLLKNPILLQFDSLIFQVLLQFSLGLSVQTTVLLWTNAAIQQRMDSNRCLLS